MPPPERVRFPTGVAGLQWMVTDDGSRTLFSDAVGETYHSGCGAAAESLFVYLINSGIAARLMDHQPCRVLEVGFGTGTAFLLTAALAQQFQTPLHYAACEKWLLPAELFAPLDIAASVAGAGHNPFLTNCPIMLDATPMQTLQTAWMAARQQLETSQLEASQLEASQLEASQLDIRQCDVVPVRHRLPLTQWVTLELILGDVRSFRSSEEVPYHAVYFDPFSPETSPELWTPAIFQQMFDCLEAGGTLTSYCVKGAIRRDLHSVGFDVSKCPGPPSGKREVLVARRPGA